MALGCPGVPKRKRHGCWVLSLENGVLDGIFSRDLFAFWASGWAGHLLLDMVAVISTAERH